MRLRLVPWLLAAAGLAAAGLVPAAAGAKPLVGVLTVDALSPDEAAALELSLPRAPALAARWLVISPAELSALLAREASVSSKVDAARAHQQRAEQALTQMERETALAASTAAVAALEQVSGRLHVPDDLVRARLVQAQARLLQPTDTQGARSALSAALAVNPALKIDPTRISPRVAGLLEQVRADHRPAARPTQAELETLARIGAIPQLVWIRVRRRGTAPAEVVTVELLVYARGGGLQAQTSELAPSTLARRLPGLVAEALQRTQPRAHLAAVEVPLAPAAPIASSAPRRSGVPSSPPWYRRWWVWAAVGVAVVGTAVGVGFAASDAQSDYELVVRF